MNNTMIIATELMTKYGLEPDDIMNLIDQFGDLPYHTYAEWKKLGYQVKRGQTAVFSVPLWMYTTAPTKTVREAMAAEGKEAPNDPHYYMKNSHLFAIEQVERVKVAG